MLQKRFFETKYLIGEYIEKCRKSPASLNELVNENSIVLDVGCQQGRNLNAIVNVNKNKKIGFDIYDAAKVYAYKKLPERDFLFLIADLREMPFKYGSFDFIICNHVIEHVNKLEGEKALVEFYKLLKPGGFLFIETVNRHSLTKLLKNVLKKFKLYNIVKKFFLFNPPKSEKMKKVLESHKRTWFHEYEYSFSELKERIEELFDIVEYDAASIQWFSFTKPITLLNCLLSWNITEKILELIDALFKFFSLQKVMDNFYFIAKRSSKNKLS